MDRFIDTRSVEAEIVDVRARLLENDAILNPLIQARGRLENCQREIRTLGNK